MIMVLNGMVAAPPEVPLVPDIRAGVRLALLLQNWPGCNWLLLSCKARTRHNRTRKQRLKPTQVHGKTLVVPVAALVRTGTAGAGNPSPAAPLNGRPVNRRCRWRQPNDVRPAGAQEAVPVVELHHKYRSGHRSQAGTGGIKRDQSQQAKRAQV